MATTYRIHPAIGIARVGNSDDFFVGPERMGERPAPAGGFKDGDCRIKRQAARFRIFADHGNGTFDEITDAEAEISWTVHLANKKAAFAGRGNSESAGDLTIDPGARSTDGPNQRETFDDGVIRFSGQPATTVPLGEIRTDGDNRLLVFGGAGHSASPGGDGIIGFWGNPGWYDDIADGPVSATIKLRADGATPAVEGAWVISAPPKYSPEQDSVTTLHDRILQAMVDAGLATAPTQTFYTEDVYPILNRARDIKWVYSTGAHNWVEPVVAPATKTAIYNRLRPGGNMPQLNNADSALTPIQHAHMERWKDGVNFTDDWTGVPPPQSIVTPQGMDRAALDACVGGAFYPGIEAGGRSNGERPILEAGNYASAFRINHATVTAGTISASMALPWQADFYACGANWWPVPRPNQVIPEGTGTYQEWARGIGDYAAMVANWSKLGFVVEQGGKHVEVDRCDTASISLLTPHLDFIDIPQGPMGMVREQALAISFEIIAPSTAVTLEYAPGGAPSHPQLVAHNVSVTAGPTSGAAVATARFWVIYRTGAAPSAIPTQTVTVREPVSGRTWSITIDGNTIARKTAAVALVLDRSGSMNEDRGDGQTKHASLQQAAGIFVDVMLEGDGVGIVRYNQDAQVLQPILPLGDGALSDTNRANALGIIGGDGLGPAGSTSIGDGIFEGNNILGAAGAFDVKALAVLTDGVENSPRMIADVAGDITANTYAIGFGTPQNTSAAALQTISGNNGGYLLVTGAIGTDNRFLLEKYFLQILAGISNAEVVLDPDGRLTPGAVQRVPFQLTEGDSGVDVILLSPDIEAIDFRLQTPTGLILEPWRALAEPTMRYVRSDGLSYYRLVLPSQLVTDRFDQGGTWHALLQVGRPRMEPTREHGGVDISIARGLHAPAGAHRTPVRERAGITNELHRAFAVARATASPADAAMVVAATPPGNRQAMASAQHRSIPYSVIVHSYSNVMFRATLHQDSWEPGARVRIDAWLTQSSVPLDGDSVVWGELTLPDGRPLTLDFAQAGEGRFEAEFPANGTGAHRIRVRARGVTRKGLPFTREQTLTAVAWRGGNREPGGGWGGQEGLNGWGNTGGGGSRDELCALLMCLLERGGAIGPTLEKRLHAAGIDLDLVRKCIAGHCRHTAKPRGRRREG